MPEPAAWRYQKITKPMFDTPFAEVTLAGRVIPMTGGVICPPVDDAASTAAAKWRLKPILIMVGMVSAPVVTVLAMDDPEIEPRSAEDTTETLAGPPA